jgi:hypothetical protein
MSGNLLQFGQRSLARIWFLVNFDGYWTGRPGAQTRHGPTSCVASDGAGGWSAGTFHEVEGRNQAPQLGPCLAQHNAKPQFAFGPPRTRERRTVNRPRPHFVLDSLTRGEVIHVADEFLEKEH